jgi:S-formylglutathione hydrolase FrmB
MNRTRIFFTGYIFLFAAIILCTPVLLAAQTGLKFDVAISGGLVSAPQNGRLFVFISKKGGREPRLADEDVSLNAPPMLAKDVNNFTANIANISGGASHAVIDGSAVSYPIGLDKLPAGEYFVQALLETNIDVRSLNAPGNLYSAVKKVHLDPAAGGTVALELSEIVPAEQLPADTAHVKFIKLRSDLLSKFYGRPIFLRAGIILPKDYENETGRRYPVLFRIGGYGQPYSSVKNILGEDDAPAKFNRRAAGFREIWMAGDTPRMIEVQLDGDGPYGDSYQLNSANGGPYGDALTQELIPEIEKKFRAAGTPGSRFLTGGSTGGWVSLALQIFYPDYFNGTWSGFPDPLDFRAYQLVNIYADDNAYVNSHGVERPSARDPNGDTEFTMRLECQKENVLGAGDSYTMSGGQWGAWNAVFGPRGPDGRPVPLWDSKTGKIDKTVAKQWEKYDLRMVVEKNWKTLAPKLKGKIHIWVGEEDDYFLNNGVHLFDDFISKADPKYEGWILYNRTGRHGWEAKPRVELMKEMMQRMGK